VPATLRSLAEADPSRPVAVCRELTKKFEQVVRGTATEVSRTFHETPKGEITLVLGPRERVVDDEPALAGVAELVDAGISRKRAVEIVSSLTGVARNRLYRGSL